MIISAFDFAFLLSPFYTIWFVDRLGRKGSILLGVAIDMAGSIALAMCDWFTCEQSRAFLYVVVSARIFLGLGSALQKVCMGPLMIEAAEKD